MKDLLGLVGVLELVQLMQQRRICEPLGFVPTYVTSRFQFLSSKPSRQQFQRHVLETGTGMGGFRDKMGRSGVGGI